MKVVYIPLLISFNVNAQNINDWENPDINGINKEKPHAYNFLFEKKANNSSIQSLNGIWKFKWSPDPQSRPTDFYKENYSTENWNTVATTSIIMEHSLAARLYCLIVSLRMGKLLLD